MAQSIPGDGSDDVHPVVGTYDYAAAIEVDVMGDSRLKDSTNAEAVRVRMLVRNILAMGTDDLCFDIQLVQSAIMEMVAGRHTMAEDLRDHVSRAR
jgi:hypothetical protein